MAARESYNVCPGEETSLSCMDLPNDELPRQGLIDALVDLDLEFDREREVLSRSSLGAALKARLLTKLRDQYCITRQPYMQQLAALSELA